MNIDIKNTWTNIIENKNFNKIVMIISLIVFVVLSLYKVINHVPFFDEINAWNIAQNFKPWEILEITKHEGHLFIWYYLLMPFAQNDIGYPIAMKLINWAFCFGAILILWFKAPFNPIIKTFITFSMPIQVLYKEARCYSVGVFLLFSLCALYKNRLKHPYWYAILLILIANTSIIAMILAFSLGLCFLYDLFINTKNKNFDYKKLIAIISLCAIGAIIVIVQLWNFSTPYYSLTLREATKIHPLYDFFLGYNISTINIIRIILIASLCGILTFAWDFFKEDKRPFVFLLSSYAIYLVLFAYFYSGAFWHYIFFFIAIIIAVWIYLLEYKITQPFQKTYLNLFCIIFFILTFCGSYGHEGIQKSLLKYMTKHNIQNTKVFFYPAHAHSIGVIHELKNSGITYYDSIGNNTKSKDLYIHQYDTPTVDFDKIYQLLEIGEKAYIFIEKFDKCAFDEQFNTLAKIYMFNHKNLDIKFVELDNHTYVWTITKIK